MDHQTEQSERESSAEPDAAPVESLRTVVATALAEILEYLHYTLVLQVDRAKYLATKTAFFAAVVFLGMVLGGTLVLVAGALLLLGLAGLVGSALDNFWLGAVIIGFAVLAMPCMVLSITWLILKRRISYSLKARYQQMKQEQRERFGRSIQEV